MRLFRRVILPSGFLIVLLVIAVALAWMAFRPAQASNTGDVYATGELMESIIMVERTTIENTVELTGTVSRDPAVEATAPEAGEVNYFYVKEGDRVAAGAQLYQVRSEAAPPESDASEPGNESGDEGDTAGAEAPSAPAPTYRTVRAERGGVVQAIDTALGDEVAKGDAVVRVSPETYTASAQVEPALLYRLVDAPNEASVAVDKGPEPFECTGLRISDGGTGSSAAPTSPPDGDAEAPSEGGATSGGAEARCAVPDGVQVFDGLALTLTIDAGSAEDVLSVPVTAVRGQTGEGSVWLLDETGEGVETRVELGLNDGSMVEVKSGVEEGQEILEFVPGSEPEDPYSEDFGGSEDFGEIDEGTVIEEGGW